ncbi:omptin family outer membrane protease [Vibrio hepatarius]|uniref:omptin family outer membrane protease n=1 Tax=Vibrio hepatarius TaxID=171383 RepID=UPI002090ABF4|nr:omptin family outer membrane protease [Vibrio hepatarius]
MTIKNLPLILIPLVLAPEAMAANKTNDIKLEGAIGLLNGSSTELVYDDGQKLSQLDWKIENVPIIKLGATWDINEKWTVKGGFWSVMSDNGDAHMEDRDWEDPNQSSPTDISISPDTKLRNAYEIDLNATYWLLSESNYKIGALAGYQYNQFKWDGIGGTYSYNNGADVGSFPDNSVGIDYKQEFKVFYLGLAGEYSINKSDFGAQVKWSPWVDAKDRDNHNERDLTFYEQSNGNSDFVSLTLNYGYNFTPNVKLYAEYVYTIYDEAKAKTTMIDNATGEVDSFDNSAGLDNKNSLVSVGLKYSF